MEIGGCGMEMEGSMGWNGEFERECVDRTGDWNKYICLEIGRGCCGMGGCGWTGIVLGERKPEQASFSKGSFSTEPSIPLLWFWWEAVSAMEGSLLFADQKRVRRSLISARSFLNHYTTPLPELLGRDDPILLDPCAWMQRRSSGPRSTLTWCWCGFGCSK